MQLTIEQRLDIMDKNIFELKRLLEKLIDKQPVLKVGETEIEILRVKQVAQFTGLDPNIIYAKCAKGDIPYFKMGKQYRFKKTEILKWVDQQKNVPAFSVDDYVEEYMQKNILKG